MIIGLGMDIIETARVAKAMCNPYFLDKVFTADEKELLAGRNYNTQVAAGIFAAKEAVVKALGTGFGRIRWTDVEVLRRHGGEPYINLYAEAKKEFMRLNSSRILITISHIADLAAATAVLEGNGT